MRGSAPVTISVCFRCRPPDSAETSDTERPGGALALALHRRLSGWSDARRVELRRVRCLSQCKRPCVFALSGEGRFTYLFGDLDPGRDIGAVLEALDLYVRRADGFMERSERPPVLRAGILGRIPPLGSTHEIVQVMHLDTPDGSSSLKNLPE